MRNEAGQPLDLLEQVLQHPAVLFGRAGRAESDLGLGPHRGQRGAQLVGGVGGEPPDFLERSLEPRDHRVEGPGEVAQFVFGSGSIKSTVQSRGGDFGRRGGHPIDGGESLAGQPVSARDRTSQGKRSDRRGTPHTSSLQSALTLGARFGGQE